MTKSKIGITIGNPNGIGPEVAAKALSRLTPDEASRMLVVGDTQTLQSYLPHFQSVELVSAESAGAGFQLEPGKPTVAAGLLSYLYLQKAVQLAQSGAIQGIVTAPVSKEWVVKAGIKDFVDHTTFLGRAYHSQDYSMLFYSRDFRVILATIHLPLKLVPKMITKEGLRKTVQNAISFCQAEFKNQDYRIAVCGLNPHAGEHGLLGHEEDRVIRPVLQEFQAKGVRIDGPLPSDTVFYQAHAGRYQMVVAMYHDQALAPFKLLHFMDGVNVTVGLPVVRTSPDHGTAFDIAGKGIASETSMLEAIRLALKLINP